MKSGRKKLHRNVCAYVVALVCGLGFYTWRTDAQTVDSNAAGHSSTGVASTSHVAKGGR